MEALVYRLILLLPVLGFTTGCSYYWDLRQPIETGCVDPLAFYMDADDDGWGSAADFIASAKATHGRADVALAVTVPHMLEIGELEGNWKKAFESIVSEREEGDGAEGEAKPGRWAYADEVGGAARFLAKDGAGGGEARFSGLWRSIDSGALPSAAFIYI